MCRLHCSLSVRQIAYQLDAHGRRLQSTAPTVCHRVCCKCLACIGKRSPHLCHTHTHTAETSAQSVSVDALDDALDAFLNEAVDASTRCSKLNGTVDDRQLAQTACQAVRIVKDGKRWQKMVNYKSYILLINSISMLYVVAASPASRSPKRGLGILRCGLPAIDLKNNMDF